MPSFTQGEKNTVIFHNFYKFYNSIYVLIYTLILDYIIYKNYILVIEKR